MFPRRRGWTSPNSLISGGKKILRRSSDWSNARASFDLRYQPAWIRLMSSNSPKAALFRLNNLFIRIPLRSSELTRYRMSHRMETLPVDRLYTCELPPPVKSDFDTSTQSNNRGGCLNPESFSWRGVSGESPNPLHLKTEHAHEVLYETP